MSQTAEAFLKLCKENAKHPDVFSFLSANDPLPAREKLEVVLVDQFQRWTNNQAVPVEHYMKRVPDLKNTVAVPLLVEEYGYLEERGAAPAAHEFVQRFDSLHADAFALLCEELEVEQSEDADSKSSSSDCNDALPVRRIGRYEVVCSIGRGAFGEVFLGKDPSLNRSVAIKIPTRERIESGGGLEQLLDEAQVVARLDHPNIVPVYDFGKSDDGGCFIVTKYIKGKDLRSETRKAISHSEAAQITAALARALHVAHAAGVIHRDVKPANVILDAQRRPHLLDFGLALRHQNTNTPTALIGTPAYMSPEQARCDGGAVDGRSDIYSLGVVFYEMLSGRRPTSSASEIQPPRQFAETIPRELERICLKALSAQVTNRYNTGNDLAEEIEAWIQQTSDSAARAQLQTPSSDSSIRWRNVSQLPKGPSIAVMRFTNSGGQPEEQSLASGLSEQISTLLAKFKDLFILGLGATAAYHDQSFDVHEVGNKLNVDYLLTGSVRRMSNQIRVTAEIVDTSTSASLWSKSFRGDLSTQDVFDIEDEIAQQVAVNLGLLDGVVATARIASRQRLSVGLDAYDCLTRFFHYRKSADIEAISPSIRKELEELLDRESGYSSVWAALSIVYLDAFLFEFPHAESAEKLFEMSGAAARRAVEADPDNAMALMALFRNDFHCGRLAAFSEGAERAMVANPNDTEMLFFVGLYQYVLGNFDRGLALSRKAAAMTPNPSDYHFLVEFWDAMLNQDYELALNQVNHSVILFHWGPAYRACCFGYLGRPEDAQREWASLMNDKPDFMERFVLEVKIWNVCETIQQAFLVGLIQAGVIPAPAQNESES